MCFYEKKMRWLGGPVHGRPNGGGYSARAFGFLLRRPGELRDARAPAPRVLSWGEEKKWFIFRDNSFFTFPELYFNHWIHSNSFIRIFINFIDIKHEWFSCTKTSECSYFSFFERCSSDGECKPVARRRHLRVNKRLLQVKNRDLRTFIAVHYCCVFHWPRNPVSRW